MFVREGGRCPAEEFLDECPRPIRKTFEHQFGAVSIMGASYELHQRFHPLHDAGKPLWEFKKHDHRLFCVREVAGGSVTIVLLNGWVKDKEGRAAAQEAREIAKAKSLYEEYLKAVKGKGKPC